MEMSNTPVKREWLPAIPLTRTLGQAAMRIISAIIFLTLVSVSFPAFSTATPDRAKGISMHMMPKRVADIGGKKWGLVVTYAEYLKPEPAEPVVQSAMEFLTFVRKQDKVVQENGAWIVTTHPDAYSAPEKDVLEDIKALCRKQSIPLFIVRGSELPNGWRRYDNTPLNP